MKKLLGVFFAVLLLPVFAQADSITFTSDANIQAGDTWMNVYIYATPPNHTTVTMTGGSVNDSMGVFDAATFNMSGGNVGGLNAYNYSSVTISGGTVAALTLRDNSSAIISGNASIYTAAVNEASLLNMSGGSVACMGVDGILNLTGGTIIDYLSADFPATVNVFGYELVKTSTGGTYGLGQVIGIWQDNSPFTINLGSYDAYSTINLILIPEPATILVFVLGSLFLRKSLS